MLGHQGGPGKKVRTDGDNTHRPAGRLEELLSFLWGEGGMEIHGRGSFDRDLKEGSVCGHLESNWWRSYTDQPLLPLHHHSYLGTQRNQFKWPSMSSQYNPTATCTGFTCVPFLPALTPPRYCGSSAPVVPHGSAKVRSSMPERWVVQLLSRWGSFFLGVWSTQEKTSKLGRLSTFNKLCPFF